MGRGRDIKIIIDTREQLPLKFAVPTERGTLSVGDYQGRWADGTLSKVVFERKSLNDLYITLSMGYERFKRELQRAKEQDIKIIIAVEGTLRRVLKGASHSQRTPISLVYQIFTIRVRYGIETIFFTDREEMSQYIIFMFRALENEYEDSKLTEKREPHN